MTHERIDADGRWISEDGKTWLLVEPSEEFLARHSDENEDEMPV